MDNPFVITVISWFIPGLGHLAQKKWRRGIILGIVIWGMFIIALFSGGAFYPGFEFKDGTLLYLLNIFARMGNGLGAVISFLLVGGAPQNVAAWTTFEYGGRFLEVAGLLNFLAVIDAVDIQQGRKK